MILTALTFVICSEISWACDSVHVYHDAILGSGAVISSVPPTSLHYHSRDGFLCSVLDLHHDEIAGPAQIYHSVKRLRTLYERSQKNHWNIHKLCYHPVTNDLLSMSDGRAKVKPC